MNKITKLATAIIVLSMLTFASAKSAITERAAQIEGDRGEVIGWAIAAGAACVLGALVYAAYTTVITKWIGKIN